MSMRWHRKVGVSALILGILPAVAAAQDESRSLDELLRSGRLLLGDGVYVTNAGGSRLKGTITDVSTTAVEVVHRGQTWRVAARDLRLIERQDPLADGFAKGLLVSWGLFYGLCEASGAHYCLPYSLSRYVAIPYLLGGAVGLLVDATTHQTVYRARASRRTAVAPILSQGRYGARVSVGW